MSFVNLTVSGTNRQVFLRKDVLDTALQNDPHLLSRASAPTVPDTKLPLSSAHGPSNQPLASRSVAVGSTETGGEPRYITQADLDRITSGGAPHKLEDDLVLFNESFSKAGRAGLKAEVEANKNGRSNWESNTQRPVYREFRNGNAVEIYSDPKRLVADEDRLLQALEGQGSIMAKLKNLPPQQPGPKLYETRQTFDAECKPFLIGRDAFNKRMPQREELARGYAIFNNAKNAKLATNQEHIIVFGRTPDTNHTGASQAGYTSEYHNGSVLMPERWNYFMNDCWVMGGIKAGASFVSATEFQKVTRDDIATAKEPGNQARQGMKEEDDFRSDWSETIPGEDNPLHYIMTVSVAELGALQDCGYVSEPHPDFGFILRPGPDTDAIRENYSFTDLSLTTEKARLQQSIENLTGETHLADGFLNFMRPATGDPQQVQADAHKYVDGLRSFGKPTSDPDNKFIRKGDHKIAMATARIDAQRAQGSNSDRSVIDRAVREICNSVWFVAEDYVNKDIPHPAQRTMLPSLDDSIVMDPILKASMQEEKQIIKVVLFQKVQSDISNNRPLSLATTADIRHFITDARSDATAFRNTAEGKLATKIISELAGIKSRFDILVTNKYWMDQPVQGDWERGELDTLWPAYERDLSRRVADGLNIDSLNTLNDIKDFVENYKY